MRRSGSGSLLTLSEVGFMGAFLLVTVESHQGERFTNTVWGLCAEKETNKEWQRHSQHHFSLLSE